MQYITHNINILQLAKCRAVTSVNKELWLPLQIATPNCNHKAREGKKKQPKKPHTFVLLNVLPYNDSYPN